MLPKKNRVSRKEVEEIFKADSPTKRNSRIINSPNLTFRFILTNSSNKPKISFIVPKTVSKGAVDRNSLRRRGYNALKAHILKFPNGLIGVFLFKKSIGSISEVKDEVKTILMKLKSV